MPHSYLDEFRKEKFKAGEKHYENVHVYSCNKNEFRHYTGVLAVYKYESKYWSESFSHTLILAKEPGVIYNGAVWFLEENTEKAIDLFIADAESRINDNYRKIQNMKDRIENLQMYRKEHY